MNSPVTIDDVARLASVSPKTVSRVVNGEAHVREGTRAAVLQAIAELGYHPNLAARSLASARSRLIGLITMRLDSHYFRALHSHGVRACHEHGLHLIVEEMEAINRDTLRHLENSIRQMRFEGVIVTNATDEPEILELLERMNVRYVRISPGTEHRRSDEVGIDFAQGLKLVAEHLWSLGHRRIAICSPREEWRDVVRDELIGRGCKPGQLQSMVMNWLVSPVEAGHELGAAILASKQRPTAVYAFNDEVAAGLISYLWAHGVHVPRDISVVGFDDGDMARAVWPPITTVRQPFDEMVRNAVRLLVEPATDGKPREVLCPVQLIVRESTTAVLTEK